MRACVCVLAGALDTTTITTHHYSSPTPRIIHWALAIIDQAPRGVFRQSSVPVLLPLASALPSLASSAIRFTPHRTRAIRLAQPTIFISTCYFVAGLAREHHHTITPSSDSRLGRPAGALGLSV